MSFSRGLKEKNKENKEKERKRKRKQKRGREWKRGIRFFSEKNINFYLNGKKLVCYCAHIYNEINEKSEGGTG